METSRPGEGPSPARIMLVGEYWGDEEFRRMSPFQGGSGIELNRMLHEAGIMRSECYATNLINDKPRGDYWQTDKWIAKTKKEVTLAHVHFRDRMVLPLVVAGYKRLVGEILKVQPNIIVTLGGMSLWALTGAWGVMKWRGSQLRATDDLVDWEGDPLGTGPKLIPTINPAAVMREWTLRHTVVQDLRRVRREIETKEYTNVPQWNFTLRPSYEKAQKTLEVLRENADLAGPESPLWLDFDLETRAGHIACAGISWSREDALCIPFMCVENKEGYWQPDEEAALILSLYRLLTHPRVRVRGQNLLYDCQYTYRHWHWVPRVAQDTMLSHHSCFSGLQKSLAFQASLYCDHYVYWKDDGKTWAKNVGEDQLWSYNCVDCVRTREVGEVSAANIKSMGLEAVDAFQQRLFWPVLWAMQRGVRVNQKTRERFADVLMEEMTDREAKFQVALGHPLNPASPLQMTKLFYEDLGQQKNYGKAPRPGVPGGLSCDKEALLKIQTREPLLRPLIRWIEEYRSLGVLLKTFVLASLDTDERMRCSYNICGTETYRFSSSENAFGTGGNLQNVPKGGEDDDSDLVLPNVREIYIPDSGFTMFDTDLSKADLRIVTWESDEREMKAMLAEGRDPYVEAAREFYRDPTITKNREDGSEHPRYRTFKSFAHGSHYLGTPFGLARRLGLTVHEVDRTQKWYFGRFPGIPKWQTRFKAELRSKRYVQNIFGYRRYYFDRIDEATEREAIAWLPQSTVAIYINNIWVRLWDSHKDFVQVLMQVHDSLVGQFPTHRRVEGIAAIKAAAQIVLPYDDPLVIPVGIKTSEVSWGECD
jgi:DNA polymerase I-like protein with 3'-5' exonuclease and polymerase domains/uracil-DNA glycosylase